VVEKNIVTEMLEATGTVSATQNALVRVSLDQQRELNELWKLTQRAVFDAENLASYSMAPSDRMKENFDTLERVGDIAKRLRRQFGV